ncbi:hypothetical protein M427DRAFT_382479 [Gonapodya prolifera JEL478]|uniref:Uncharacterized protein n=1 Tax=Gonapodya prolifera (strain JEL478) TaxID=1344416 RepID=A0A139A9G0_GONPJ|nr:hypothetical protein M427DRAFT_382479 [Gonapodya prolifera JEL478]|eukprot:KXS13299.1 hypothetical protein M427DRAFT_382479 [Gonapodya prolifera JEL478]
MAAAIASDVSPGPVPEAEDGSDPAVSERVLRPPVSVWSPASPGNRGTAPPKPEPAPSHVPARKATHAADSSSGSGGGTAYIRSRMFDPGAIPGGVVGAVSGTEGRRRCG